MFDLNAAENTEQWKRYKPDFWFCTQNCFFPTAQKKHIYYICP
jgi:hypothetical protein